MRKVTASLASAILLVATPVLALDPTTIQGQINTLLAQIKALQDQLAALQGGSNTPLCLDLSYNFGPNDTDATTGGEVTKIQRFLVSHGLMSATLPFGYFGPATMRALQAWQTQKGIVSSGAPDSTGYGFLGPKTRRALACTGQEPIPKECPIYQRLLCGADETITFDTDARGCKAPRCTPVATGKCGVSSFSVGSVCPGALGSDSVRYKGARFTCHDGFSGTVDVQDSCVTPQSLQQSAERACANRCSSTAFRVESPNGGEALTVGQPFTIRWNIDGATLGGYGNNVVRLSLIPQTVPCTVPYCKEERPLEVGNFKASTLSYSWTPPASLADAAYKLKAELSDGTCVPLGAYPFPSGIATCLAMALSLAKDESDDWFKIKGDSTNRPPVISSFSGPTTLKVNEQGTWKIQASDPENGALTYSIDWGEPQPGLSSGARMDALDTSFRQTTTFTHSYANPGTYIVRVSVHDNANQAAQTSSTVRVGSTAIDCTKVPPTTGPESLEWQKTCRPADCAAVYIPMCGLRPWSCNAPAGAVCNAPSRDSLLTTYDNRCELERAGAEFVRSGACPSTPNVCWAPARYGDKVAKELGTRESPFGEGESTQTIWSPEGVTTVADASFVCRSGEWKVEGGNWGPQSSTKNDFTANALSGLEAALKGLQSLLAR